MPHTMGLFRPESGEPMYTDERCFITELMNTNASEDVSLAECRVAPGVTTQLHQLEVAERYVVTAGLGRMELEHNQIFNIGPGDCVVIPALCPQRVVNVGKEDLVFHCVCTPRFQLHHYIDLETRETALIKEVQ